MKHFLLVCIAFCFSSSVWAFGKKDSLFDRKFIVKTSTAGPFYSGQSWADAGFEFSLFDHFTLDTDLGMYFRMMFKNNPEHTRGQFTNVALRYYFDELDLHDFFCGVQYKYDHKISVIELDFSDAGYPYSKYIDADRHSNSVLLIGGMQQGFWFEWLRFEYYGGLGLEYRVGRLSGLTDYEWDAIETGQVSGVQWDDPKGRFIPGWTVGCKVGISLGDLNWSLRRK